MKLIFDWDESKVSPNRTTHKVSFDEARPYSKIPSWSHSRTTFILMKEE